MHFLGRTVVANRVVANRVVANSVGQLVVAVGRRKSVAHAMKLSRAMIASLWSNTEMAG